MEPVAVLASLRRVEPLKALKTSFSTLNNPTTQGDLEGTLMFLLNHLKFVTHPESDKSIPRDPMIFAEKTFFYICLMLSPLVWGGLRSSAAIRFHKRTGLDFLGDPQNGVPHWLDVFMMLHRPDSEMKEAPLEGFCVLIRGHYLYTVSGSWLVTSQ